MVPDAPLETSSPRCGGRASAWRAVSIPACHSPPSEWQWGGWFSSVASSSCCSSPIFYGERGSRQPVARLSYAPSSPSHNDGPVSASPVIRSPRRRETRSPRSRWPHPSADPALGAALGVITIPAIDLSMVVVEGTGDDQLRSGPGHYPGTPLPGEAGNSAIAGHRTTYLHPFYNLNDLVAGDPITIETVQGIFLYHVTSSLIVAPNDVSVIAATTTPTLTLTTCNPRLQRHPASGGTRFAGGEHPLPRQIGAGNGHPENSQRQHQLVRSQLVGCHPVGSGRGHSHYGGMGRSSTSAARPQGPGPRFWPRGVVGGGVLLFPSGGSATAGQLLTRQPATDRLIG